MDDLDRMARAGGVRLLECRQPVRAIDLAEGGDEYLSHMLRYSATILADALIEANCFSRNEIVDGDEPFTKYLVLQVPVVADQHMLGEFERAVRKAADRRANAKMAKLRQVVRDGVSHWGCEVGSTDIPKTQVLDLLDQAYFNKLVSDD